MKRLLTVILLLLPSLAIAQLGEGTPVWQAATGTAAYDHRFAAAGWNGSHYLGIWNERTPQNRLVMRAVRFTRSGEVLDQRPVTLETDARAMHLAWTGSHWVVFWANEGAYASHVSVISTDLVVQSTTLIARTNTFWGTAMAVISGRIALGMQVGHDGPYEIVLLDDRGRPLGPKVTRARESWMTSMSLTAGDGTFLDLMETAGPVTAIEYDRDLRELRRFTIPTTSPTGWNAATWTGSGYLIVGVTGGEMVTATVSGDRISGPRTVGKVPTYGNLLAVAANPAGAILTYRVNTGGFLVLGSTYTYDLHAIRLDREGSPTGEPFRVTRHWGQNDLADLLTDGTDYLFAVAFAPSSAVFDRFHSRAIFVRGTAGTETLDVPLQRGTIRTRTLKMASNGTSRIFVATTEPREDDRLSLMYSIDGGPQQLIERVFYENVSVAPGSGHYLVVWRDGYSPLWGRAVIIRDDGTLVARIDLGAPPAGQWWDCESWIVVTRDGRFTRILVSGVEVPLGRIEGVEVGKAAGLRSNALLLVGANVIAVDVRTTPRVVNRSRIDAEHWAASIATNGQEFLVAFASSGILRWQLFGADGTPRSPFLGPSFPFGAPSAILAHRGEWLLTYADQSGVAFVRVGKDPLHFGPYTPIEGSGDNGTLPQIVVADEKVWLLRSETVREPPMNGGNRWLMHEVVVDSAPPSRRRAM